MSWNRRALALAALSVGCGGDPAGGMDAGDVPSVSDLGVGADGARPTPPGVPVPTFFEALFVREVQWNPAMAATGAVAAVAEDGRTTVLFSDRGAVVFNGGAVSATDTSIRMWRSAGAIPAGEGTGTWIVGVDAMGRLQRLRPTHTLEDVTDRFGLAMQPVRFLGHAGERWVGFATETSVAVADGMQLRRYMQGPAEHFAAGGRRVAASGGGAVRALAPATNTLRTYELAGVTGLALDATGRLVVAAGRYLYTETPEGALRPVFQASEAIHGMTAAGMRVWFTAGTELGSVEGARVAMTSGAMVPADARLTGATNGEVWSLSRGALRRFQVDSATHTPEEVWNVTMRPVFVRACSACHLPGGSSRIDLASYRAWDEKRELIRRRVVDRLPTAMPPPGSPLSAEDREVIRRWTEMM
ncbi:MAG: cytochrome c [Deltaproteobacteria bacterium]|nr:cytochrome c [Deltaproteobacteria bacterium]